MDRLADLRAKFDTTPYAVFLGMKVVGLESGVARLSMQLRPEYLNWVGLIHGGAMISLADQAFGCALNTLERTYVAVHLSTAFVAAPKADATLTAEARVIRAGRQIGNVEIVVRDDTGRIVLESLGTSVAVEGLEAPASPTG